jgi:hypothetical protein
MTEVIEAWQCIGCGKLEAPQNCIGACQDRRVELGDFERSYRALQAEARTLLRTDAAA